MKRAVLLTILFAVTIAFARESAQSWQKGIVFFKRGDYQIRREIMSYPRPLRRKFAEKYLKALNASYLRQFVAELKQNGLEAKVKVVRSLWLGNGAIIMWCDNTTKDKLEKLPSVEAIYEDFWGYEALGTNSPADALDIAWGVTKIGAPSAWAAGLRGQNVLVAILDSGVRYTHDDLRNNMWFNDDEIPSNGVDDDGNGYIDDYYGYDFINDDGDPMDDMPVFYHGTHCAGIVAGTGASGTQTGVAPRAKIMAVKVIAASGTGNAAALALGLQYAAENYADVISLSMGFRNPDDLVKNFARPLMEDLLLLGIPAAVAAGNEGGVYPAPHDISSPADCPSPWQRPGEDSARTAAIAVGATDQYDRIAASSSYGPTEWNTDRYNDYPYPPGLMKPDVAAPGVSINSTWGGSDNGYWRSSGTSMAAPHVAGALALMLSKNPLATPELLDSLLQTTALDRGRPGKDSLYGSGRIRANVAVSRVPAPTEPLITYRKYRLFERTGDGNGIPDPGETANLLVFIRNDGAKAFGVEATISTPCTLIDIVDSFAIYGNLDVGEVKANETDSFEIDISSTAPNGLTFPLIIRAEDDSGNSWVDTFTVMISRYARTTQEIRTSLLTLTITNFGELGFFDPTRTGSPGVGFVYGGYNYLFGGTAILAFGYEDVVTGEDGINSEFMPVSSIETATPGPGDRMLSTAFVDSQSRVLVKMDAITWTTPTDANFIILRYITENISDATIDSFYFGVYLDFDINFDATSHVWQDLARWNSSLGFGYMWDGSTLPPNPAYVGIASVIGGIRGSVVHNPTHVYPDSMGWVDSVKYNFLAGRFSLSTGSTGDDWSLIIGDGPISLAPGESDTFAYAIIAADNESEFRAKALQARSHAGELVKIGEQAAKPEKLQIDAAPNPFNDVVTIKLTNSKKAELKIYDIKGTIVLSRKIGANSIFKWDAKGLPTGLYIIKASDGTQNVSKKVLLIK